MKRFGFLAAAALAALSAAPMAAQAQQVGPVAALPAGHTLLTVSAEGSSTREPDLATFSAGVTTQEPTASAALAANSKRMTAVFSALEKAGIAAKDIQTSNLSVNPVYSQPQRQPDGSYDENERRIVAYQVNNFVQVRQRKLGEYGKVIDALVSAGANQVSGPDFALTKPEAAQDEARAEAMKIARERANLYAKAAGLRVVGIVSIAENGGYVAPQAKYGFRQAMAEAAPPPVASGELDVSSGVTVQFELAP